MTKEEIQHVALERCEAVEEKYADRLISQEIMTFYRFNRALYLADLSEYFRECGLSKISERDVNAGKGLMGYGPMTAFEIQCCDYLNDQIEQEVRRRQSSHRHLTIL